MFIQHKEITFKKLARLSTPEIVANTKLIVAPVYMAETANTVPILTKVELATKPASTFDQISIRVNALSASKALTRSLVSPLSTRSNN